MLASGIAMSAADTSGSVAAVKGLQLNGNSVPVEGTKAWPVEAGDELKSNAAPVVLTMRDGSKVVLGKNSRAKLEAGTIRLIDGTMQYQIAQESKLQVAVKGEVLPARSGVASTVVNPVAPAVVTTTAAAENLPPVSRRRP